MPAKRNASHLYTVLLELSGTTSVSQVRAASTQMALSQWTGKLRESDAYGLSRDTARQLYNAISYLEGIHVPVPLDGLDNVWCVSALVGSELALINIVETCGKLTASAIQKAPNK
jgi:hypothetical protein